MTRRGGEYCRRVDERLLGDVGGEGGLVDDGHQLAGLGRHRGERRELAVELPARRGGRGRRAGRRALLSAVRRSCRCPAPRSAAPKRARCSAVYVAYSRRHGRPRCSHAAVTQRDTAMWSGWNVIPSGPNVRIVSGWTSSSSRPTAARPSSSWSARAPSGSPRMRWSATPRTAIAAAASQVRRRPRRSGGQVCGIGGPVLAGGGRHAHDALAAIDGRGHHAGGEVGLVVGVRPDRQDGAQIARGDQRVHRHDHPGAGAAGVAAGLVAAAVDRAVGCGDPDAAVAGGVVAGERRSPARRRRCRCRCWRWRRCARRRRCRSP